MSNNEKSAKLGRRCSELTNSRMPRHSLYQNLKSAERKLEFLIDTPTNFEFQTEGNLSQSQIVGRTDMSKDLSKFGSYLSGQGKRYQF